MRSIPRSAWVAWSLTLAILPACRAKNAAVALILGENANEGTTAAAPSGAVLNGVWQDSEFPWTLRLPPDWEVVPGSHGGNPRVTLIHRESRARIEVSAWPDGELGPRPRRGCSWSFEDVGGYRALAIAGPIKVATCSPDDARDARILGYFLLEPGTAYDIEAVLPPGRLIDGKDATDAVLGGLRFQRPP